MNYIDEITSYASSYVAIIFTGIVMATVGVLLLISVLCCIDLLATFALVILKIAFYVLCIL